MTRTEIGDALTRNDKDTRAIMDQAGAMGLADTGTRLAVQGLYQARERLLALAALDDESLAEVAAKLPGVL